MRIEEPPPWEDDAACIDAPRGIFFPTRVEGESNRGEDAKAWCARCPVARPCIITAMTRRERDGVWGGAGEPTRRRLLRLTIDRTPDSHPPDCTCGFCIAVTAHLNAITRAYNGNQPAHGHWEAYLHAGCRCTPCSDAYRASGLIQTA